MSTFVLYANEIKGDLNSLTLDDVDLKYVTRARHHNVLSCKYYRWVGNPSKKTEKRDLKLAK